MKLRDLSTAPPGNWHLRHPSGFVSTAVTFQALVQRVAQYRKNRNQPIVSENYARLSDEIEADICASMTPANQIAYCDTKFRAGKKIHWREVARFLATLAAWIKTGFALVSQEEAERRAAICATCPLNVGMVGCGACRTTLSAVREELMKATTIQDAQLQACNICGCDNKTQVHVPIAVLRAAKDLEYPAGWCWKSKGGVNEATI